MFPWPAEGGGITSSLPYGFDSAQPPVKERSQAKLIDNNMFFE
ncbi:hypothetical protein ADICYQ_0555 [Cyclobacterium qasimii M12-11B]|uniref:Uncharacterized protein n=1 Tax=Cyclobacterium qasimii M12-11B TaxID=641524 RepID=S7VLS0_9BACT|nr:hypothetical protein ADICYQ_0555 [Cyclobacterium qasimii M12-11B]